MPESRPMGSSLGVFPPGPGSRATEPELCSQSLGRLHQQLDQNKLLHKRQLAGCRQQENLIEKLTKQRDALQAQHEAFLEQVGSSCCLPCTAPLLEEDNPSQDAQRRGWVDLS